MKQKAYRFDGFEQFDALIGKFGEDYFAHVPRRGYVEECGEAGFLYEKVDGSGSWTSDSVKNFLSNTDTYGEKQMITFAQAMSEFDNYLPTLLEELQGTINKLQSYINSQKQ